MIVVCYVSRVKIRPVMNYHERYYNGAIVGMGRPSPGGQGQVLLPAGNRWCCPVCLHLRSGTSTFQQSVHRRKGKWKGTCSAVHTRSQGACRVIIAEAVLLALNIFLACLHIIVALRQLTGNR
ncbi:hypothetical protein ETA_30470 [Erwinia tasmaniensis Et1/99]|uniref:Uncharacterized protein n=1 Tax=Erwinia tasmaniensis (strain DSM 17950 / CFBP 7177 / CIP 109463 / NCPPB 4357 / Et1/99) TaxID=465817 RepID=B2VCP0_ERWT9|nr:hypothetical protein ETA_30470 [Erwinia tasmaniensis Et1/99]